MSDLGPIFVRGFSRSGGTLTVTLLDAHPDVGMSYELYPHLLLDDAGEPVGVDQALELLGRGDSIKASGQKIEDRNLRTFVLRCARGGLELIDLQELFEEQRDAPSFAETDERFRFIGRCADRARSKKAKRRWGLKCNNRFDDYLRIFPDGRFVNIVRDGRDVLASQLNTGSFKNSPEKLGKSWSATHRRFRKFLAKHPDRGFALVYEQLVSDPENHVRQLCDFLQLDFVSEMLSFHSQDLSIFQTNHLSKDRISKPIDTSKVGRWKQDLDPAQVAEFSETAKDELAHWGYVDG
ncbi:MAG: sulfotransferase [Acidobacteriota bacterium]